MDGDSGGKSGEMKRKKDFVLDTNVFIHDPEALESFEDNDVIIPIMVIEELDDLKSGVGEVPYSARKALRSIGYYSKKGDVSKGVGLPGGGKLRVETIGINYFSENKPDNLIVSCAIELAKDQAKNVILVSKDTGVRIKAEAKGVRAQDYRRDKTSLFQKYGKILNGQDYANGILSVRYFQNSNGDIDRFWDKDSSISIRKRSDVFGVSPKNIEQACALDALTSPDVSIIALTGKAGAGKTFLALAAALHQVTKNKKDRQFEQVIVARPTIPMSGYDLGFLPGDVAEKIDPWMHPIYDNLSALVKNDIDPGPGKNCASRHGGYEELIHQGFLSIVALTYIRGRSLPRKYVIIDEAQNLRPLDVKTIVTRLGEGSKIVFAGDLGQIDTPYLDAESNGLAYLIARLINEPDFCYLNFEKSARSKLADRMAALL